MSVTQTNPSEKKKFNVGDFLMSILPLFIMLALNTIATIPAVIIGMVNTLSRKTMETGTDGQLMVNEFLADNGAQTAVMIGLICYAIVSIIIFHFWYKKAFLKKQITISNKEIFTVKNVILVVLVAIGCQAAIDLALSGIYVLLPDVMESYSQTLESAGLGTNIITTLIYANILGPIAEELMFRGVTQAYLRRSNLVTGLVIFFQALSFGIAHLNPVQSSYALVLGLMLGFLRHKFGNIRVTVLAHIAFNVLGTYGIAALGLIPSDAVQYAIMGICTVIGIVALVLIAKQPTKQIEKPLEATAPTVDTNAVKVAPVAQA
ncbi:MAG: CPBP family intramembrane metalloprotease [Clostridiales bacterium]|nr:CPBP family intramembrane metalloprotease [Clostridiales bacterium]